MCLQVCMDDSQEWQTLDRLTTLVLGQGRFWGGGLQILPAADPTDGLMDVVALQGLGVWDFLSKGVGEAWWVVVVVVGGGG
jgi:diacylglycerol kinase family enzyme